MKQGPFAAKLLGPNTISPNPNSWSLQSSGASSDFICRRFHRKSRTHQILARLPKSAADAAAQLRCRISAQPSTKSLHARPIPQPPPPPNSATAATA